MKILSTLIALVFLGMAQAQAAPELSFEQAAKIASDYLRDQGLSGKHHISSLALEPSTLMRKKFDWVAKWTPSVDHGDRKETGLQISMDGSVARIVDKKAKEKK